MDKIIGEIHATTTLLGEIKDLKEMIRLQAKVIKILRSNLSRFQTCEHCSFLAPRNSDYANKPYFCKNGEPVEVDPDSTCKDWKASDERLY